MGRASDELAKRAASGRPGRAVGSPAEKTEPMVRIWDDIRRYGLEENIAELETRGLTVVQPEKAATPEFIERLRAATLRFIESRDGRKPDVASGDTHRNQILGDYHYLILHDPVFQELLCQPVAVTLLDYLLGESSIVHANSALCKGPHDDELVPGSDLVLPLHSDSQLLPGPFHPFAEFANVTWTLSDYSREGGSLAYVPGSHLLCRHPMPGEGVDRAIAVEAPAGSIICWHGNTWHGAFRRRIPGLRLSIGSIFTRPYIWPRHPLREDVTQEVLDANPPRFARFCGRHVMTGWREDGPLYGPDVIHAYPTRFH
jgi:ectoine hydroxylase-related dioxygenase (phytanoyl-CoA dioxygenase family)